MNKVLESIYSPRHKAKDSAGGGSSSFQKERGEMFVDWIGRGKKVLDIGCRDGRISRYLLESSNEVTGFDIDSRALSLCPKGMATEQHDLNGGWHLNHKEEFDAVVISEVMEHLYYPDQVLKKITHVLKAGGLLVGTVPNAFNLKNRFRLLLARPQNTPLGEPTHINHFSATILERLLLREFTDVEIGAIVQPRWKWLAKLSPGLGGFLLTFKCVKKAL